MIKQSDIYIIRLLFCLPKIQARQKCRAFYIDKNARRENTMRRKQRNIAATLLAGMLLLLTMFTVSAQSNTITPTLKKVGYGIKDSSGTVNVYEQAFLIKSGAVNVHGGIAICFDTGKPAAKSGTTYQYIGLAQNQTGSYSAKQAYNCMLAAESIITKSKYNSLTNEMKAAAIHRAVSKYKEYGSGVTGGAFSGSADVKCTTAQATLMVQLQTEIVKAAKALNKELPSTATQTGTISAIKAGGDYFSGSSYVLAVYKLSESGVTASVDASGTNISGVRASVSGTTLTVSVPTANLNGSGNWKVKLTKTATANVETMLAYQISGNTANQRLVMLDTIAVKKNLSNYVSGTFQNEGVIEVYKEGTGGEKLAGAVFTATNQATGQKTLIGPTNAQGYAKNTQPLPIGQYIVTETTFPDGWKQADGQPTSWNVEITKAKTTVTIQAVNAPAVGDLELTKTSEDGIVSGIAFTVTGPNNYKATVDTNILGKWKLTGLKPGIYTVIETVPDRYIPQTAKIVTVTAGRTAAISFHNTLKRGSIQVSKVNHSGNTLSGAEFLLEVSKDNGATWNPVTSAECSSAGLANGKLTTGSDGIAKFENLPVIPTMRYRLTETKAPEESALLADSLYDGTLPLTGDYSLSLTAVDGRLLVLPATGENGIWLITVAVATFFLTSVTLLKQIKENKDHE